MHELPESAILYASDRHGVYIAWADICDNAVLTDSDGVTYYLWQDGDLWLVPTDHEWGEY